MLGIYGKGLFTTTPSIYEKEICRIVESAQFILPFQVLSPFASSFTPMYPQKEAENRQKNPRETESGEVSLANPAK